MNAQNGRPPGLTSCIRTSVFLAPVAVSAHNPRYACRGEEVAFICEVTYGASLEWASEPDISRNLPISYTAFNIEGETRTSGSYRSHLVSVARSPPRSNFTSNLTFAPSPSVNSVTVVCGDQLSSCRKTEEIHTLAITGKCMLMLFINLLNLDYTQCILGKYLG